MNFTRSRCKWGLQVKCGYLLLLVYVFLQCYNLWKCFTPLLSTYNWILLWDCLQAEASLQTKKNRRSDFLIQQWAVNHFTHIQCDGSQADCVWVMQKQRGVSLTNNVHVWSVWGTLPFFFPRPSYRRHTAACTVRRSVEGHTSSQSWCSADIWSQWMQQWCYSTDMASAEKEKQCVNPCICRLLFN